MDLSEHGCSKRKGGFRPSIFIFVLEVLESMGFVANTLSLVLYFNQELHFDISGSANSLTNLMGSTFMLSILGGFIADTYINRFTSCLIFGAFEVLGLLLITIQARYESLQPEACGKSSCIHGGKAVMFYASLAFYAMGSGCLRASLPAVGADQFDKRNPKEAKALARYFNCLMLFVTFGSMIGVTVIVWISTNKGWWKSFLIILIGTLLGYCFLASGKPFFRIQKPGESPILRIIQVIVVAIKNRKLSPPESAEELYEPDEKDLNSASEKIAHTDQFRCLDKAAILPDGTGTGAWKVCTVTQVEETKILIRMLPIVASTVIMITCLAQLQTFSVQQGYMTNRKLGSFEVPASSVPVIPLVFMSILIPIYEYVVAPFARKFTHHPSGVLPLQRVGVGLVLSIISMCAAALVELKRKNQSTRSHMQKPIHVSWLAFQYAILGIADMFTLVGLQEFFYGEAPEHMKSLCTSFTWLSFSLGYFLSSVLVDIINSITRRVRHDKQGWLDGMSLDNFKLNLFYWFLAILSCLNFFNYLYWASWYKYKKTATATSSSSTSSSEDDHHDRSKAKEGRISWNNEI